MVVFSLPFICLVSISKTSKYSHNLVGFSLVYQEGTLPLGIILAVYVRYHGKKK
jgi:hypothetical protein